MPRRSNGDGLAGPTARLDASRRLGSLVFIRPADRRRWRILHVASAYGHRPRDDFRVRSTSRRGAVDLVIEARGAASLHWTVIGLLCGATVFSSVNWLLSRRGAQHRKRCGECVEQPTEEQQRGSGLAIAAGSFLDGVPEGLVLGLSVLQQGAPGLGTVTAFFLSNIPEALSSSAGMRRAVRSARYVFGVWIGIALMIGVAAAVAGLVLRGTGPAVRGTVQAFAAGTILALVSETMIPESFHGSPQFNGLLLVVGFVALLILLVLSH